MYALQDAGLATFALPAPTYSTGPPDTVEPRAVESTEQSSIQAEGRQTHMFTSTAAALQLLETSAEGLTQILSRTMDGGAIAGSSVATSGSGQVVDVYV